MSTAPSPFYVARGDTQETPVDEFQQLHGEAEEADSAMDAKVRELADRARASQPPVTTRRLEPVEAAPSEAKGAVLSEQAGPAPVLSSPPPSEEESVRPAVPPPATPAARRAPRGEQQEQAAWRREAIIEWVAERGTVSIVEIREQFDLSTSSNDIARLEADGRLVRTGAKRPSGRGGPPSPEVRVPEQVASDRDELPSYLAAEPFDMPLYQRAGTPASDSSTSTEARESEPPSQDVVPAALSVHQELTVHYVRTLIGWVARGQTTREQAPPEHVFDRIERLLGIEDGVA